MQFEAGCMQGNGGSHSHSKSKSQDGTTNNSVISSKRGYNEFWGMSWSLVIWLAFGIGVLICSLDLVEWLIRYYTISQYPSNQLPISHEPKEILYGGWIPHYLLKLIDLLRRQNALLSQSLIPIPSTIPLYSLLPEYDFIIVGGGTAGSVVVSRLSDYQNISILLLEAGGPSLNGILSSELLPLASLLNQNTEYDWKYRSVPQTHACLGQPNNVSFWPRGKILGGTSVLNFMIYHRGHPNDYDLWSTCLQDERWSSNNVAKLFQKMENANFLNLTSRNEEIPFPRGFNGPLPISLKSPLSTFSKAFISASRKIGFKDASQYNTGTDTVGSGPLEFIKHPIKGQRSSAYRGYLHSKVALGSSTDANTILHVVPYAHVTRLVIDHETIDGVPKAVGVEFALVPTSLKDLTPEQLQARQRQIVKASKEIVLSSGAIGTPQILMNSGIGPKDHLSSIFNKSSINNKHHIIDLPGVGQHLIDHILHPSMFSARQDRTLRSQLLSIPNALRPTSLWNYFGIPKGKGMLSTPGADTQIMVPSFKELPRSLPTFCNGLQHDTQISKLLSVPDLQILFYGGAPDVWELEDKLNLQRDVVLRLGTPSDWNLTPTMIKLFRSLPGTLDERLKQLTGFGTNLNILILMPVLLQPESQGSISLRSSNPFEKPIIDPRYLTSPRDIEVMLKGVRIVEKMFGTEEWRSVVQDFMRPNCPDRFRTTNKSDPNTTNWELGELPKDHQEFCTTQEYGSDEFWKTFIRRLTLTLYHPVGTCRMGRSDDRMSCTNSRLQLNAVKGVRISDASVMPVIISGNTQAAVMMIGEMTAELLKEEYRLQ